MRHGAARDGHSFLDCSIVPGVRESGGVERRCVVWLAPSATGPPATPHTMVRVVAGTNVPATTRTI
jgi:hypothetical protein